MRGIRITPEADRVLLVAQTRKGKTTLSRRIVGWLQPVRVIVFDIKDELDLGAVKARSPAELAAHMHDPVVHYVPSSFDRDSIEEAFQIVWITPGPYVLWITEAAAISGPNYCPEGLRLECTQGAAQGKLVIAETQRISECNPVLRAGADHVFVFVPAPIELDLKTLAGVVRREHAVLKSELDQLQAEHGLYSHLWYALEDDELRRCAPIDPGTPWRATPSHGEPPPAMDDPGAPQPTEGDPGEPGQATSADG